MQSFPQTIHVGMKVFDNAHHEIGHVKDLRFPENAIDPQVETATLDAPDRDPRPDSIIEQVAEAFHGDDDLPETLRERLLNEGYIRIDSALSANHYALPSQIASASGDEVVLNVGKDELITRH